MTGPLPGYVIADRRTGKRYTLLPVEGPRSNKHPDFLSFRSINGDETLRLPAAVANVVMDIVERPA